MEYTSKGKSKYGFVVILAMLAMITLLFSPSNAWAFYHDQDTADNAFHVDKRPLLVDIDVSVPEDYVLKSQTIDPGIFEVDPIFKFGYEEAAIPENIVVSPTTVPEETKGTIDIEVTYSYGTTAVTTTVPIQADVPPKTIPASNLGVGSKVKFGNNSSITWTVIDKNHSGYPGNSLTLMAMNYGTRRIHHTDMFSGSSADVRYKDTEIRGWLNSATGFLSGWTDSERNALLNTALSNPIGDRWTDKVFLIGGAEAGKDSSISTAYETQFGITKGANALYWTTIWNSTMDRHWTRNLKFSSNGVLQYWAIYSDEAGYKVGNYMYERATNWYKIDPIVNISQSTAFRATPDSSGCYIAYFPN